MTTWREALEHYFQCRTKGMIVEAEELDSYLGEGTKAEMIQACNARRRQQLSARNARPLKSRLQLSGIQIEKEGTTEIIVRVEANEWYAYQLENQWYEQEKEVRTRIVLRKCEENWVVEQEEPIVAHLNAWESEALEVLCLGGNDKYEVEDGSEHGLRYTYDRLQAVRYAEAWWDGYNPQFRHFDVDCTNFISQCLYAGGIPMRYTGNKATGWWYRGGNSPSAQWSHSWAVAHSFRWYLEKGGHIKTEVKTSAGELSLGDVICYDFDGDGRWQHSTIVVAKDSQGMPLVNAHTTNSRHRYWDYHDSTAYTPRIQYRFFHIL
ncbi:amidase domain-containing protein [Aneurinibacillus thermoaerophilus]|uniref:amidase domain-containing protein n=1 Tax=Aneurinibacillus thermoaerophilus TaxID=143495 RepID=UPI001FE26F6B|nr:amidase domain-containing protein [Aneurinibacillus thermoaerophilus]MED0678198.1 amidase domain-containing protein [Aneurinibacillus thermoaerophilus]MED0765677.1 amidase domain-containing protein [Aneurinibacillus thermoaerophilus]